MKRLLLLIAAVPLFVGAQVCTPGSNVVIFTNYDGGQLNINVDVDIPNLKIGIVSYEAVQVNFSGPFTSNITEVRYAGYNGSNNHCGTGISTTTFNGLPAGAASSVSFAPSATVSDPNGNGSIICGYSCSTTSSQGGCNTANQIVEYFYQVFNVNSVYSHTIQYGCWSGFKNISDGGNCCPPPPPTPPLNSSATANNSSCANACSGSATVTPTGGLSPYSYSWGSNANNATTATVTNLCPGTYSVTVTDANGTTTTSSVTVTEPQPLSANETITQPSCHGETGSVQLNVSGGTPNYNFDWNGLDPNALPGGTHDVTITDANNCEISSTIVINEPPALTASFTNLPDLGNCDGSLAIDVQGGVAPYTYNWLSLNETNDNVNDLCAGNYCVEITDANNCIEEFCETIESVASILDSEKGNEKITLAPNPSTEGTTLIINNAKYSNYEIRIIDVLGKEISRTSLINNGTAAQEVKLNAPINGVYFINISNTEKEIVQTLKWIKQ